MGCSSFLFWSLKIPLTECHPDAIIATAVVERIHLALWALSSVGQSLRLITG